MKQIENFSKSYLKKDLPDIRPGDEVRISQKLRENAKGEKERIQAFEGTVIARAHRKEVGATITIRRVISGIGVEKIFPIHSPNIVKIEILKKGRPRRAKLYYLRGAKGKRAKIKRRE
jgi:large subunit ribosomal protein L19